MFSPFRKNYTIDHVEYLFSAADLIDSYFSQYGYPSIFQKWSTKKEEYTPFTLNPKNCYDQEKDINENQEDYTVWFVIAFDYFYKNFKK